ncbi:MAG: metallophosphoesterase [Promethearchaeota archaeon]|nr:MAG: metallophosphoesterase [Candidatus Lokiarchaeota archaeon]
MAVPSSDVEIKEQLTKNREMNHSILVNPNLGHPRILNLDKNLNKNHFQTNLLFISDIDNLDEFGHSLKTQLSLKPILEYKWKLKYEKKKIKRIKRIWYRIKNFFSRKKKKKWKKLFSEKKPDYDYYLKNLNFISKKQLKKLKSRALRGDEVFPKILNIIRASTNSIKNPAYLEDEYCYPQDYLLKYNVFDSLNHFYSINIEFKITKEISDYLKSHNFIMFDIVHKNDLEKTRINHHALVISKNNWRNFKFIQITDLHLAERNDMMYGIIKHWIKTLRRKYIKLFKKRVSKKNQNKNDNNFLDLTHRIDLSFKKRLINPNNMFRKFIKSVNKKVLQNKIEFVIVTGDIVDFTILSELPTKFQNMFEYEFTNWNTFKNIILNKSKRKRIGIIKGEELLCPIFTLLGNHDYRPWHYDLNWGKLYKKMGLKKKEAEILTSKFKPFPIKSILKSNSALKGYLSDICPNLDFSLKLGKNLLILLNTGSDSYKNLKDFIMGLPSVTGIKEKQIRYLENLVNYNKIQEGTNFLLFLHGPPINPKQKLKMLSRIKRWCSKEKMTDLDDFKESKIINSGKTLSKARIDNKFNLRLGTISSNWEKIMKFCSDFCNLTLCGHTHTLNEFRIENINRKNVKSSIRPYLLDKDVSLLKIYYDDYSEIYKTYKEIENHNSFIVQTPSLGLRSYKGGGRIGAYREIEIKKNKLHSFRVKYLHK